MFSSCQRTLPQIPVASLFYFIRASIANVRVAGYEYSPGPAYNILILKPDLTLINKIQAQIPCYTYTDVAFSGLFLRQNLLLSRLIKIEKTSK